MIGLVSPAIFVAVGETEEGARALALQAERAEVLRVMSAPRSRWYTHRVLPVCPYPPGWRGTELDPWSVPAGLGERERATHFGEPVLYRLLHGGVMDRAALWAAFFSHVATRDWRRWTT